MHRERPVIAPEADHRLAKQVANEEEDNDDSVAKLADESEPEARSTSREGSARWLRQGRLNQVCVYPENSDASVCIPLSYIYIYIYII